MKHKVICLILCLLLFPSLFLSVGAEQQYVIDNADLMSSSVNGRPICAKSRGCGGGCSFCGGL